MSIRTDEVNIRVNISGDKARNELNQLQKKKAELRAEMKGFNKESQEFKNLDKEYKTVTSEVERLQKQIGLTSLTQKELNQQLRVLRAQRSNLVPDTKEFNRVQGEIEQVSNRLREVRMGAHSFQGAMDSLGGQLKKFGMIAMSYLGFQFLSSQFKNLIGDTAKFVDQLADVRKVTGMTAESVNELADGLKKIDTRTANSDLREMAVAAGKLGIHGKENLLSFVEAVDQINVALGDDLSGGTEEVMKQIGKLVQIFKVDQDFELGESILKVGSAMNELTNTSSASADYIVEFTRRMGGIAPLINVPIDQTMALGATLDQLGQTSEVSTTALSKMFIKMASDSKNFARYAGMEVNAFKELLEDDFMGAFAKVLDGVKGSSDGINQLAVTLGDLGADSGHVVSVLGTLANNTELLRDQIDLSNIAFVEGTSVTEEFMVKNDNFAATVDKLSKSFDNLVTSNEVRSLIEGIIERVVKLVDWFTKSFKWINENRIAFIAFTTAIIAQAGWIGRLTQTLALLTTGIRTTTAAQAGMVISQTLMTAKTHALTLAKSLLTLQIGKAREAFIALSATMRLNPIALIAATVAAGIIAFNKYSESIDKTNKELKAMSEIEREVKIGMSESIAIQRIANNVLKDKNATLEAQNKALNQLIGLNPALLSGLTKENTLTAEGTRLRNLYNNQIAESIRLRSIEARIKKQQEKADQLGAIEGDVDFAIAGGKGIKFDDIPKELQDALLQQTNRTPWATSMLSKIVSFDVNNKKQLEALKSILIKEQQDIHAQIEDALQNHAVVSDNMIAAEKATQEQNIKLLENTLKGLDKDSKEFKKAEAELKKAQAMLKGGIEETTSGGAVVPIESEKDDKKKQQNLDKKAKELEAILKQVETLRLQIEENTARADNDLDKMQAIELEKNMQKYEELMKQAKDHGEQILILEGMQEIELQQLREKHFNEYTAREFEQQKVFLDEYYQEQIERAQEAYTNGFISLADYNERIEKLTKDRLNDEKKLYADYANSVTNAADMLEKAKTAIMAKEVEERKKLNDEEYRSEVARLERTILTTSEYSAERLEAQKELLALERDQILENEQLTNEERLLVIEEYNKEVLDLQKEFLLGWGDLVMGYFKQIGEAITGLTDIKNNKEENALNQDKKRYKERELALANQLDNGIISREEYDARMHKMNLEMDKKEQALREKQAQRNKKAAIFNAIVQMATAVLNGLATQPLIPVGLAMGAMAGVLGGIQIAKIKSEPVPTGRKGLVVRGPSHEAGGIDMINNQTGERIANIEGGEPVMVLSRNTYKNNKGLIDELIYNSQMRNGAKLNLNKAFYRPQMAFKTSELAPMMQSGGVAFANAEMQRNMMSEFMKVSQIQMKAAINDSPELTPVNEESKLDEMLALNIDLYNKLLEMEANKQAQKSYVVYQDFKDKETLHNKTKRAAGF